MDILQSGGKDILKVCACDSEEHLWIFDMLFLSVEVDL